MARRDLIVGIDFGGTKILATVFNRQYKILGREKKETDAKDGVRRVIRRIARCVFDAIDDADASIRQVRAVGIGAPAPVDPVTGTILDAPNLGWKNIHLKKDLENILKVPVFVENDVNVGALGEQQRGAARGADSVCGIFIGTGIGGGIILEGKIYGGFQHTAGEVGHMTLDASSSKKEATGLKGTLEALASRLAINRDIRNEIRDGHKSILAKPGSGWRSKNDLSWIKSKPLARAIKRHDRVATMIMDRACEYIGIATANIIHVLNPEIIVLGGGVFEALGPFMLPRIRKSAKAHTFPPCFKSVRIVGHMLGDNAGVIGAAVYARQRLTQRGR
jgi:glucokinase